MWHQNKQSIRPLPGLRLSFWEQAAGDATTAETTQTINNEAINYAKTTKYHRQGLVQSQT
jgi:hypothetical protein